MDRPEDEDEARSDKRLNDAAKPRQPEPPKKEGDDSPNPLPDDRSERDPEGGDPGRT